MIVMFEMVLLFNGFGGMVLFLLGWVVFLSMSDRVMLNIGVFIFVILFFIVLVGGVIFFGFVIVWGKFLGKMMFKVVIFIGLRELSIVYIIVMIVVGYLFIIDF